MLRVSKSRYGWFRPVFLFGWGEKNHRGVNHSIRVFLLPQRLDSVVSGRERLATERHVGEFCQAHVDQAPRGLLTVRKSKAPILHAVVSFKTCGGGGSRSGKDCAQRKARRMNDE
jgi:hypothetical protein